MCESCGEKSVCVCVRAPEWATAPEEGEEELQQLLASRLISHSL